MELIFCFLTRIEDPQENQLRLIWLPLQILLFSFFLYGRFGEDSLEVADSSFVVASGYITDDDSSHKAKKYLENAITLYMKHGGPYHNSTIKAQVCLPEVFLLLLKL